MRIIASPNRCRLLGQHRSATDVKVFRHLRTIRMFAGHVLFDDVLEIALHFAFFALILSGNAVHMRCMPHHLRAIRIAFGAHHAYPFVNHFHRITRRQDNRIERFVGQRGRRSV